MASFNSKPFEERKSIHAQLETGEFRLPWKTRIRERLADILGLPLDRTGLQAKTAEGLGDIGAGRALEARAVVLLVPVAG